MSIDSTAIDIAVLQRLSGDAALTALMPGGVFFDSAPPQTTRFVLVSVAHSVDARSFAARSHEAIRYLVKAVALSSTPNANSDTGKAAARIDALLDPQPPDPPVTLTVNGYSTMAVFRDPEAARIRMTEPDEVDPTIRFFHRGAYYFVAMSL